MQQAISDIHSYAARFRISFVRLTFLFEEQQHSCLADLLRRAQFPSKVDGSLGCTPNTSIAYFRYVLKAPPPQPLQTPLTPPNAPNPSKRP
ncbi:hypothetical protein M8J76_014186 [Diaphorina citri]|nr:hypothetical protein M8J76_014186 [Diaphorina citri]